MRIEQMISGAGGFENSEAESEPEPSGLTPYAQQVVDISRAFSDTLRLHDWISDSEESRIVIRPKRIEASLGGKAFENYCAFSFEDRHEIEYRAMESMYNIDPSIQLDSVNVMLNYVPLLFAGQNMVRGYRRWRGNSISFESDKIHRESELHALTGSLATILYYVDYPDALKIVE